MDSILVFDDFKHCFRELDTSNYNDDLVVGSVFFTRDAINVIEKYYRIIGYIICDDKGVYYPIDIIAKKHMEEYVNRCVVKFILSESKYGYIGSGISDELS